MSESQLVLKQRVRVGMAVTAACFKWADVLETQFDKSWVELDTVLSQLEDDEVTTAMCFPCLFLPDFC